MILLREERLAFAAAQGVRFRINDMTVIEVLFSKLHNCIVQN
jgi:hypothetical protein